MKLKDCLKEAGVGSSNYHGRLPGIFSTYNVGYRPIAGNDGIDPLTSELDPHLEDQIISQAIDILFSEYPELIQDKKVRRHHLQMLIGKITNGNIQTDIDIDRFIKKLKKDKKIKTI